MLGSTTTVRVDVVGGVMVVGVNVRVRPAGGDAVRSTGPLKPLRGVTVIVAVCESPGVIVKRVGLDASVKSGPTTVTIREVLL